MEDVPPLPFNTTLIACAGRAKERGQPAFAKYRFLDTHLRLSNAHAYHALAVDEHRASFTPTLWTKTTLTGANPAPARPIENVEQRWFAGAHANVGGGYPSDLLAQVPLRWLMAKAASSGLKFRSPVEIDQTNVDPPSTFAVLEDCYTTSFPDAALEPLSVCARFPSRIVIKAVVR